MTLRGISFLWFAPVLLFASGCGDSSSTTDQGGAGGSGAGGTGGSGGSSAAASCPASPPPNATPCTPPWEASTDAFLATVLVHCSWGDDPRPGCRTTAACLDGAWQVTEPAALSCGDPSPADRCPAPPPESGSACSDTVVSCYSEDGTRCWCSACRGGSAYPVCQTVDPPEWACATAVAGCNPLPQAGSVCDTPDANCGLSCDRPVRCVDGVWQWLDCPSCCPICAAPDTPIATPDGEVPIASLRVGDLVYSVDDRAIVPVPLIRVDHTTVRHHRVVRVTLDTGAVLEMSPGHPTADGRTFGELAAGTRFDETHQVVSAERVPYGFDATYDILSASSTGTYVAAGALVGSTLFRPGAGQQVRARGSQTAVNRESGRPNKKP